MDRRRNCGPHRANPLQPKHLYPPSKQFVPLIYTPLYFYLSAAVTSIIGIPLFSARLVSVISLTVTVSFIYKLIYRETHSKFFAVIGIGLFAATYTLSETFMDLAHVDMLFAAFLTGGFYLLGTRSPSFQSDLAGLGLLLLAFLTKQVGIIALGVSFIYLLVTRKPQHSISLIILTTGILWFTLLSINSTTQGWFGYYLQLPILESPAHHTLIDFWTKDLLVNLPVPFIIAILLLVTLSTQKDFRKLVYYGSFAIAVSIISWASRLHIGSITNVIIPTHIFLAIAAPIGLHFIQRLNLHSQPHRRLLYQTSLLSLSINIISLFYHPATFIPSPEIQTGTQHIIETIADIDGPVWVVNHPFFARLSGKEVFFGGNAGWDIVRGGPSPISDKFIAMVEETINSQFFSAIVFDDAVAFSNHPKMIPLHSIVKESYQLAQTLTSSHPIFTAGWLTQPKYIYIPKDINDD